MQTLGCDTAAEGLLLQGDPFRPDVDMGESGLLVTVDASTEEPYAHLIGATLGEIKELWVPGDSKPIGVLHRFPDVGQLVVVNWGDDLLIDGSLPSGVAASSPREI